MSSFSFQVITLFPEMIEAAMGAGVFSQARKKNLLQLEFIQPRDFTSDVHRTVDDRPFGGGDGMIMLAEPLAACIQKAKSTQNAKVIYLSPQGATLTAEKARAFADEPGLILVCGRYGGIDQRIINAFVDEEVSIGDYVLSGGELAACVLMDAVSRFVPGVLGHKESADKDSFSSGLLEHPNFTKPRVYNGEEVPEVLLSGHHKAIDEWKLSVSLLITLAKRPELILSALRENVTLRKDFSKAQAMWQKMTASQIAVLGLGGLSAESFNQVETAFASNPQGGF